MDKIINHCFFLFIEEDVEEGSIPEELPPPLIEPVSNAHDPKSRDHDWKDDLDAYAEPERSGNTSL